MSFDGLIRYGGLPLPSETKKAKEWWTGLSVEAKDHLTKKYSSKQFGDIISLTRYWKAKIAKLKQEKV